MRATNAWRNTIFTHYFQKDLRFIWKAAGWKVQARQDGGVLDLKNQAVKPAGPFHHLNEKVQCEKAGGACLEMEGVSLVCKCKTSSSPSSNTSDHLALQRKFGYYKGIPSSTNLKQMSEPSQQLSGWTVELTAAKESKASLRADVHV